MRAWIVVALGAVTLACSSTSTIDNGTAFDGLWKCTANDLLAFTEPPGSSNEQRSESETIVFTSPGDGTITAVTRVSDAGTTCGLKFTTSGNDATLVADQTCTPTGLAFTYQGGSATVSGETMTATLEYSFTGTVATAADAGTEQVAGTGTTAIQCTR
jgi:hypothetical protein